MQLIKRLPLVVPVVVVLQLFFAVSSAAALQPGNGLLAAGNYHITTSSADYFFCCGDPSLPSLSVNITATTTEANPKVGASSVTHETDVFINSCGGANFICGGGCFIPDGPADFTISGLSAATLKTSFDPATTKACQDFPVSGLPAFTINVTWSGVTNPTGSVKRVSKYDCVGYHAEVLAINSNDNAIASASSSLFAGSIPAEGGGLGSSDQRYHAQGIAQDACSSLGLGGGGKGAGPGPIGAGQFEFASQTAAANVPGGLVLLTTFASTSRPTGAPATTVGETELTVRMFGFQFLYLCFALQSPNTFSFGSGLSGASVHAVIDQNTPACTNFDNGFFSPFTVDLTWTATGPQAAIKSVSTSECGNFHALLLASDSTNPAGATGNVSIFPDPVVSTSEASINSSDHRFVIHGVAPQGCIVRG